MYDLVEMGVVAVLAVIGIVTVIAPRAVVRKSLRESRGRLMIARVLGAAITLGAVAVLLMQLDIL